MVKVPQEVFIVIDVVVICGGIIITTTERGMLFLKELGSFLYLQF